MTRPPERELTIPAFLGDGSRQIDVVKGVVCSPSETKQWRVSVL